MDVSELFFANYEDNTSYLTTDAACNKIYIKRDDLLPFCFGGNKVVIAEAHIADMKEKGCNVMIGYGDPRSNLCRVLTNMCAAENIPCEIISPKEPGVPIPFSFNGYMTQSLARNITFCFKSEVPETIEKVKKECIARGEKPYFIYDDDNVKAPISAISRRSSAISGKYDRIFLAVGTGITASGIICDLMDRASSENVPSSKLVGISVARDKEKEMSYIRKYVSLAGKNPENIPEYFTLCDDYIGEGYGATSREINETIKDVYSRFGIMLDPTYTGKAFFGMKEYLAKNNISGSSVLFWYTGGTPLFFDLLKVLGEDF